MPRDESFSFKTCKASDLMGKYVKNPQNEKLCKVEDLTINQGDGLISFAILSFDPLSEKSGKLIPIPWGVLKVSFNDSQIELIFKFSKEKLEKAPGFDKNNLPDMADRCWSMDIYNYYGYEPDRTGNGYQKYYRKKSYGCHGWGVYTEYGKMFSPDNIETIRGDVVGVDRIIPIAGMSEGVGLRLRKNGDTYVIHLGPAWYFENQGYKIWEDGSVDVASVEVKGAKAKIGNMTVYIATEISRDQETIKLRDDQGCPVWDKWAEMDGIGIYKITEIIGKRVENTKQEELGKIEELIIDIDESRVAYCLLSSSGISDLRGNLFAFSYQSLNLSHEDDVFILDIDKEEMREAGDFDKDDWMNLLAHRHEAEIYRYWE
jgi:sporulation protein YlmC with PRC-barrel domain